MYCAMFVIKTGTGIPRRYRGEGAYIERYIVNTRVISAFRWAAM